MNNVSTKQHRIAALAKRSPELAFTSLSHLIDLERLLEAYRRTRKDGATGVDGVTAADYELNLIPNLQSLLNRVHSGIYRAACATCDDPEAGQQRNATDRNSLV
ncbi:MAG: hypothetical protein P8M30_14225 [Planctomycetaceae bacterium]|nr:hypothetical protein [Planctomycetaceae bacterium]